MNHKELFLMIATKYTPPTRTTRQVEPKPINFNYIVCITIVITLLSKPKLSVHTTKRKVGTGKNARVRQTKK